MADLVFGTELYNDILSCLYASKEVHVAPQDPAVSAQGGVRVEGPPLLCFSHEETQAQAAKVLFWVGPQKPLCLDLTWLTPI